MTEAVKKRAVKVTPKVLMPDDSKKFLDKIGFNLEWLNDLAKKYKFDSFDYVNK